ncbi:MAG: HesA/MoeB/ThiF family protein [Thermoplasmatales archaeon]|nr:HesA/MoeB/ThiF family protein [Candidatus Thermoplasmatota archaeon]MCL6002542.1 HesA/MoeB/ThiF family protein [Candidatus Thermoplasmatota archaeon]MDA8054824.1 HesA/MoeB/ThiF family protein [Thermoplasmatales archaeon]
MEMERYLSQVAIKEIFPAGQKIIESSSVAVIGMGGTGSSIAEMMVRMGVKKVTIVDDDTIETSNLNRQAMYGEGDIGLKKVDVAKMKLLRINPGAEVNAIDKKLDFVNADSILSFADLIIDGTDNYDARNVINVVSFRLKKPWIFSAVEGTYGYVKAIVPGRTSCLSCFGYPEKGAGVSCTIQGVLPSAVRAISALAVTTALKVMEGKELSGDLVYLDVWKPSMEILPIARNEECKVCGEKR